MKILFIVDMEEKIKAGLFIATHNRIKTIVNHFNEHEVEVYCLKKYDDFLLKSLKKVFKKNILTKSKVSFEYEGIVYKNLYMKESLLNKILYKFGFDFFYFSTLIKKIKSQNFNFVSAHWGDSQGSLAFYLKKYKKIPYTLTLHGSDIHTYPYTIKSYKKFVLRNMNNADAVVFVSQQLKNEAEKLGFKRADSKVFISYNAVNKELFRPLSSEAITVLKNKYSTNKLVVGFVGNLNRTKRAEYLISIFKSIQSKVTNTITFFIIGDGELREKIKKEIENETLDIRIVGRISQETLCEYYNVMDCLILPSKNEGLGNVILEAQSCGTPVIATKVGGIPEVIFNAAYLVRNVENTLVEDFSTKASEILNDSKRIQFTGISWKDIVDKEIEIFKESINNK